VGAFTYPRSEPGSGGHQDLVERLNSHAVELRRDVSDLPPAALTFRPGDGEWSIKETCGHLGDAARVLHQRLFMMIKLEEPRLPGYDAWELVRERNPQSAPIADLLAEFAGQRVDTVELLTDLVHWNWARPGRHPTHGRISIRQQVELAIEHEEEHLAQVRRLKEQTLASPVATPGAS